MNSPWWEIIRLGVFASVLSIIAMGIKKNTKCLDDPDRYIKDIILKVLFGLTLSSLLSFTAWQYRLIGLSSGLYIEGGIVLGVIVLGYITAGFAIVSGSSKRWR